MSGPNRPDPHDPGEFDLPDDDAEVTRIVRRDPPAAGAESPWSGGAAAGEQHPDPNDPGPATGTPTPETAADPGGAGGPGDATGPAGDAGPTSVLPSYQPPDPGSSPTSYLDAPPTTYLAPEPAVSPPYPPGGYAYQAQEPAAPAVGPQTVPPPATATVLLPPVRMPKAESRVALNLLGTIVGLLLVAGGLALVLLNSGHMRVLDGHSATGGRLDALPLVLTILGALLIALAGLLAAWASWAPLVPGVLLSAASVWAMVTTGPGNGADRIAAGTRWAFKDGQLAAICADGLGLVIGLLLLLAGLAAVFLRAGVRRTIRQQLESIQS